MATAYKKPKQPTQSSYANIRSLTQNTAYSQEQAARSGSGGGSSPTVGNPTAPTRENAAAMAKPTMSPTQLAIQNLTQKPNNPTAPTRENAARLAASGSGGGSGGVFPKLPADSPVNQVAGNLQRAVDTVGIAANPFSDERISATTGIGPLDTALEAVANNPYKTAGVAAGAYQLASLGLASLSSLTRPTAVQSLSRVGTAGKSAAATSTAGKIATNTATTAATRTWLERLAIASTDPRAVAGTLVAAIGSYPFAGFIKEEALQTLGLATTAATRNGDLEGAQLAIDMQREVLNPDVINGIMQSIPFANVLSNLQDFWKAAGLKVQIDQRIVDDLRTKVETGETDDAYWARVSAQRDAEREAQRLADEQYYAEIARRQAAAKAAERASEEKYWAAIAKKREEEDRRKREEEAAYWEGYYRRSDDIQAPKKKNGHEEASFSKLNFGIL